MDWRSLLYFFLPGIKSLFPAGGFILPSASTSFRTLDTTSKDDLSSITVTHKDGEAYTLLYQTERLFLKRDGGTPALIDDTFADLILKAATTIAVEDIVAENLEEVRAHLGDMGLKPPEISVLVRYRDGREDVLQFGVRVPETTYYYYCWSGDNGVYMCDEGLYEAFEYTAAMLLPVEQPLLQKSLIDHMSLRLQGQESMELQFSTDSAGNCSGQLQTPFLYPLDGSVTEALLNAAANFRLGTKQGTLTGENMADYGFDNPLAVIDIHQQEGAYGEIDETGMLITQTADEQTLRIVLGRKEGDYFYTCRYAGECYLVSSFLVAPLVNATPGGMITKYPANMGDATIATIQVQLGGTVLDIRQQRTERVLPNNQLDTDQQGNILYDVTITKNGEPLNEQAFNDLVDRLKTMQVSGEVAKDFAIGTGAPRWQMTVTTQTGASRTLAAYSINQFFDAIAVDGVIQHSLQAESLEIALSDLL